MKNTILFLFFITATLHAYGQTNIQTATLEKQLQVNIKIDTNIHSIWPTVTYNCISDTSRLHYYMQLLQSEYQKYPADYLNRAHIYNLVLCQNLKVDNQYRAAVPDPYKNTLFLSIDTFYNETYLIHVMHHDLHHSTEYGWWGDMYYHWPQWDSLNPKDFKYGAGGTAAYAAENENVDYYSLSHPMPGFVNLYSMMGPEEDRCEIVALLLHSTRRAQFIAICKTDTILQKKARLIINKLNSESSSEVISLQQFEKDIK